METAIFVFIVCVVVGSILSVLIITTVGTILAFVLLTVLSITAVVETLSWRK